jgi:predicted Rossmann-fold nucleotide-binding protein
LNTCDYYRPLLDMLHRAADEGFFRPEHQRLLLTATEPEELLEAVAARIADGRLQIADWKSKI